MPTPLPRQCTRACGLRVRPDPPARVGQVHDAAFRCVVRDITLMGPTGGAAGLSLLDEVVLHLTAYGRTHLRMPF